MNLKIYNIQININKHRSNKQISKQQIICFSKMMKKPFGNIGKLKKQKPVEQQGAVQSKQSQPMIQQKPTAGKLKLNTGKNIYDAVRKVDEQKQQSSGTVLKPTLTFKKNKLGKVDKAETPQSFHNNNTDHGSKQKDQNLQQSADNHSNLPRPTPLFTRNKGKLLIGGKSKQKPVIQKEQQLVTDIGAYRNRMAYVNEDENKQRENQLPAEQQPSKKLIKPNLFKGMADRKRPNFPSSNPNQQSPQHLQQKLGNSQVYHEYTTEEKKQKFNFQKMLNVEKQAINLQRTQYHQQVSQSKIEKQTKRSNELSQLLNLQIDMYEPLTSLQSTTPFEVYISKIKSGFLKNSSDAAFDQKTEVETQTMSFEYVDFSNQCPEDYQMSAGFHKLNHNSQPNQSYDQLILKLSPVIQQLLKPSKTITMPPTSLLAFSPAFKKFLKCPLPTFIYYSQNYNYSLLTMGQKLYICDDQITCALDLGGNRIAGLKNGRLTLWNGENDRGSAMYRTIQQIIQSQNFELPVYMTNDLDKLSPYMCEGEIVGLVGADQLGSFYSLDSLGKMIKWEIEKVNKKTVLVPKQIVQFNKMTEKKYLTCFGLKRRNETFYIASSSGILLYSQHTLSHRLQSPVSMKQFYLPKRSSLVYCLTQFNTLIIYLTDYHLPILELQLNLEDGETVQELLIPQIQHQNREVALFFVTYLLTDNGILYQLRIKDNEPQVVRVKGNGKKPAHDQAGNGGKSKRTSAIIYTGINPIGQNVEKISLYRDLKCTTQIQSLPIDLSPNVNNLKSVIMKNKQFLSQIMESTICMV